MYNSSGDMSVLFYSKGGCRKEVPLSFGSIALIIIACLIVLYFLIGIPIMVYLFFLLNILILLLVIFIQFNFCKNYLTFFFLIF